MGESVCYTSCICFLIQHYGVSNQSRGSGDVLAVIYSIGVDFPMIVDVLAVIYSIGVAFPMIV